MPESCKNCRQFSREYFIPSAGLLSRNCEEKTERRWHETIIYKSEWWMRVSILPGSHQTQNFKGKKMWLKKKKNIWRFKTVSSIQLWYCIYSFSQGSLFILNIYLWSEPSIRVLFSKNLNKIKSSWYWIDTGSIYSKYFCFVTNGKLWIL